MHGGRGVAKVPCNGCRECCYHSGVDVHPELERPEDIARLDLVEHDDGSLWLRKGEDGACVHLGPEGCTVYEHRPHACRTYDCRLFALMTVLDSYDNGHTQPVWLFQPRTIESQAFMAACNLMGQEEFMKRRQRGDAACSAPEIASAVTTNPKFNEIRAAILTLMRMSPEQQKEVFGPDIAAMTPERMTEMYRALMKVPRVNATH